MLGLIAKLWPHLSGQHLRTYSLIEALESRSQFATSGGGGDREIGISSTVFVVSPGVLSEIDTVHA